MKELIRNIMLAAVLVLLPVTGFAAPEESEGFWQEEHDEEEEHGHTGEHGGQFGDASDVFHFEALIDAQGDVRVYVYDEMAKPIEDLTAVETRWTLNPSAEYPLTGELTLSEDKQYFLLDLPPMTSEHVAVEIAGKKDGQWWPIEFLLSK